MFDALRGIRSTAECPRGSPAAHAGRRRSVGVQRAGAVKLLAVESPAALCRRHSGVHLSQPRRSPSAAAHQLTVEEATKPAVAPGGIRLIQLIFHKGKVRAQACGRLESACASSISSALSCGSEAPQPPFSRGIRSVPKPALSASGSAHRAECAAVRAPQRPAIRVNIGRKAAASAS